jgi:hypothetical protein
MEELGVECDRLRVRVVDVHGETGLASDFLATVARYIEAREKELHGRRWIPVTERLPPHDETVLFTCDLGPNEGFTDVESGRWEGARNDMGLPAMRPVWGDEDDWGPCSHWVPLPAPPTARK